MSHSVAVVAAPVRVARVRAGFPGQRVQFRSAVIAIGSVGLALVLTLSVERFFVYPFLFLFLGAIAASAWFGGTLGGLLSVGLSTVSAVYFFVPPLRAFAISGSAAGDVVAFVACALIASWTTVARQRHEMALRNARDRLRAELARLSRVLTVGELTTSIAHEVNQPLTALVTHGYACADWLAATPPNVTKARESVERVIAEGERAGAVLARLRALFRKEPPQPVAVDLNDVIRELGTMLRPEADRRGITWRADLASGLPPVRGDRVQLQQVVLNLALNGMDAMAGAPAHARELTISSHAEGRRAIQVRVEDTGCGLSREASERMFQPFFTTKPDGIGMGLAISRSIIEAHEGRLWVTPRAGGTCFQFTLPCGPLGAE